MGARGNNDWAKKFQKICPDGGDLQFAVWELQVAEWSLWGKRRVNFHTTCMIRARRIKFSRRTVDSAKFEIRDHAWKSSGISSRTRISNSWQKQHLNLPRLLSGNLQPVASRVLTIRSTNSILLKVKFSRILDLRLHVSHVLLLVAISYDRSRYSSTLDVTVHESDRPRSIIWQTTVPPGFRIAFVRVQNPIPWFSGILKSQRLNPGSRVALAVAVARLF